MQYLLPPATLHSEAVRDGLRDYVVDAFGDPGAILVVGETGDVKNVKKGRALGRDATPVHRHRGPV